MTVEELQEENEFLKKAAEQNVRLLEMWSRIAELWKEFGSTVRHNTNFTVLVDETRVKEDAIVKEYST